MFSFHNSHVSQSVNYRSLLWQLSDFDLISNRLILSVAGDKTNWSCIQLFRQIDALQRTCSFCITSPCSVALARTRARAHTHTRLELKLSVFLFHLLNLAWMCVLKTCVESSICPYIKIIRNYSFSCDRKFRCRTRPQDQQSTWIGPKFKIT